MFHCCTLSLKVISIFDACLILETLFTYKLKETIHQPTTSMQYLNSSLKKINSILIALIADNWKNNCENCKKMMKDQWEGLEEHRKRFT